MPSVIRPSRSDVHVNRPLTNISIAYIQGADAFVASKAFRQLPVVKQSDAYFEYDRGEFNRDAMEERMPGAESAGGTYKVGTTTYYARVWAYHKDIPDQVRANEDSPLSSDRDATIFVTHKAMIRRERSWATQYLKDNVWTYSVDGAGARSGNLSLTVAANNNLVFWNRAAGSPIEDIQLMRRTVLESTGFEPNVLVLGRPVYDALVVSPHIIERLDRGQTTGPAMATKQQLSALFEVDEILVMNAIHNTAAEGVDAAHSFIGGKDGLLLYRPASPGILTPAAGYTFTWTGYPGAEEDGMRIKRFRMEANASDRIEVEMAFDQKLIGADLGVFIDGIVE